VLCVCVRGWVGGCCVWVWARVPGCQSMCVLAWLTPGVCAHELTNCRGMLQPFPYAWADKQFYHTGGILGLKSGPAGRILLRWTPFERNPPLECMQQVTVKEGAPLAEEDALLCIQKNERGVCWGTCLGWHASETSEACSNGRGLGLGVKRSINQSISKRVKTVKTVKTFNIQNNQSILDCRAASARARAAGVHPQEAAAAGGQAVAHGRAAVPRRGRHPNTGTVPPRSNRLLIKYIDRRTEKYIEKYIKYINRGRHPNTGRLLLVGAAATGGCSCCRWVRLLLVGAVAAGGCGCCWWVRLRLVGAAAAGRCGCCWGAAAAGVGLLLT